MRFAPVASSLFYLHSFSGVRKSYRVIPIKSDVPQRGRDRKGYVSTIHLGVSMRSSTIEPPSQRDPRCSPILTIEMVTVPNPAVMTCAVHFLWCELLYLVCLPPSGPQASQEAKTQSTTSLSEGWIGATVCSTIGPAPFFGGDVQGISEPHRA